MILVTRRSVTCPSSRVSAWSAMASSWPAKASRMRAAGPSVWARQTAAWWRASRACSRVQVGQGAGSARPRHPLREGALAQ